MSDILSQEEIDALMSTIEDIGDQDSVGSSPSWGSDNGDDAFGASSHVEIDPSTALSVSQTRKVTLYDFRRPDRVSKEQIRSLRNLHDKFARNFSSDLSGFLRTITDISLLSVDQMTYGEFLMSLPDPTSFNIISMIPLQGNAVLEINPSLVFPIIDKLLGGQGLPLFTTREMTSLEQYIVDNIINIVLKDLEDAWKQIVPNIRFKKEVTENSPHIVQVVSQTEVVVLITFEVRFGEATGMINICIPALVLEPVLNQINSQDWMMGASHGRTGENSLRLLSLLSNINVKLIVEVGQIQAQIGKVLELTEGDLIVLPKKSDRPLNIYVNNKLKYYGEAGIYGSKKAIKLTYILTEDDYIEVQ